MSIQDRVRVEHPKLKREVVIAALEQSLLGMKVRIDEPGRDKLPPPIQNSLVRFRHEAVADFGDEGAFQPNVAPVGGGVVIGVEPEDLAALNQHGPAPFTIVDCGR